MDSMEFLFCFGGLQTKRGGARAYVAPKHIIDASGMPASTVYYHLNKLMASGYIVKSKRGHYHVKFCRHTALLAMAVVTPLDMLIFSRTPNIWLSQFDELSS